jgi:hypothetical protein
MREIGDVYVVAPAAEMSGASHSLTLGRPLRIRQIDDFHWTVDGTPTDCVTLALNQILAPDIKPTSVPPESITVRISAMTLHIPARSPEL